MRRLRFCLPLIVVAVVLLGDHQIAPAAPTQSWRGGIRPQDEIIEVNTRGACCTTEPERLAAAIQVQELAVVDDQGARRWITSDLGRFTSSTPPEMTTIVYVHGNKITHCEARLRSMAVYRRLAARASDERPMRFVIWSWPAEAVPGFVNDFRVKAIRTTPVGWQLAWGLDQLPAENRVSLLGYSFGARVIGGAMQVLAGGRMNNLALAERAHPERPPMRVVFLAAATHAHWFGPGQFHGEAMHQIDRLMLVNNHLDPGMRFYWNITKTSNPTAMGKAGPTCLTPESRARTCNYDATSAVGRSHDLYKYLSLPRTITRAWEHLTYADQTVTLGSL